MGMVALPEPSFVVCQGCRRPIDVWEPPGLRIAPEPDSGRWVLTRVDPSEALCPECCIRRAPEADQGNLLALFTAHRVVRAEIEAPPLGTLFVLQNRGNTTVPWATDFGLTLYGLKVPEWSSAFPQPRLCFTPDEPSEPPINFIWFRVDVFHDMTPQSWLAFRWSYADPKRPGRMEMMGWDDPVLTEADLGRIVQGVRFFREFAAVSMGRPHGTFKRDRRWYLDAYRTQARELGRPPTQAEFCEACGVDRTTLRRNLKPSRLWPWDRFVAEASRARSVRR